MEWNYQTINKGGAHEQGLVTGESGENIAVTYSPEHAPIVAASLELFDAAVKAEQMLTEANRAFYGTGTRKALEKALGDSKSVLAELRTAIAKAKGY